MCIEQDVKSRRESRNVKVLLWRSLNARLYWQGSHIGMSVEYGTETKLERMEEETEMQQMVALAPGRTRERVETLV
jgi:hypothetical protein